MFSGATEMPWPTNVFFLMKISPQSIYSICYGSADILAADVNHHLRHTMPIVASPAPSINRPRCAKYRWSFDFHYSRSDNLREVKKGRKKEEWGVWTVDCVWSVTFGWRAGLTLCSPQGCKFAVLLSYFEEEKWTEGTKCRIAGINHHKNHYSLFLILFIYSFYFVKMHCNITVPN